MKRALIDNNNKVLQVEEQDFEVHEGLYWVNCPDDAMSGYTYDPINLTFEDPHAHTKDEFGNPVEPFSMQRMRAYPSTGEQLDLLFKEIRDTGSISTDGAWFQAILAVKQMVPKPADPSINVQHLNSDGSVVDFYENVSSTTNGSGAGALLKFRKSADSLQVTVPTPGTGYRIGDTLTVAGSSLEQDNDVVLTVSAIEGLGIIKTLTINA
jgi:hypothetical protein